MQLSLMETGLGDKVELELVDVPTAVGDELRLALGGPGAPAQAKARLWAATAGSLFAAGGYMCFALPSMDPALGPAGAFCGGMCVVACFAIGASTYLRWRALWGPDDRLDGTLVPSNCQIRDLLDGKITTNAAASLAARIRVLRPGFVVVWLFVATLCGVLVVVWFSIGRVDAAIALAWDCAMSYVLVKSLEAAVFHTEVASIIVVDRVQRVTDRVRRSTPATADFDSLLRDVVDAQRVVSTVAVELERPMLIFIVGMTSVGTGLVYLGLGPQPTDPENAWVAYKVHDLVLGLGSIYLICSILLLAVPARVTAACDRLGDAINELTETQEASEAMLHMPTKKQQHSIEHLYGYVRKLNRGKGMGFMVARKRITHSFVMSMMAKAVSVMLFFFPFIIRLTRVEGDETELLNRTHTP